MIPFSQIEHPLRRDGTSQPDRYLTALSPSAAPVDERTDQELLAFLYHFSCQVCYYDENLVKDDWSHFFRRSIPVQIALISQYDLGEIQNTYNFISGETDAIPEFSNLFLALDHIFSMAIQVRDWQRALQGDYTGYNVRINNIISNDLSPVLKKLIGIGNALRNRGYNIDESIATLRVNSSENRIWQLNIPDLLYVSNLVLDLRGSQEEKVKTILDHTRELYLTFFKGLERIVQDSALYFDASLSAIDTHQPHLGLFFSFLKLFKKSREHLNELTQKHLDFYFKDTLQCDLRAAIPDQAHLIFEPTADGSSQLVPSGSQFNAGQDDNDAEINFRAKDELIVTGARIESLRTVFLDNEPAPNADECGFEPDDTCRTRGIYSADVANSFDGKGAPFSDPSMSNWATLGSKESVEQRTNLDADGHDDARIGFLLASPVLLLQEGCRKVEIYLHVSGLDKCANGDNTDGIKSAFRVQLSGETGWIDPKMLEVDILEDPMSWPCKPPMPDPTNFTAIKLSFKLDPDMEAVTFPDPEVLTEDFGTQFPIAKIELALNPQSGDGHNQLSSYCCFKNLRVEGCCIRVEVCNLRNLVVQNETGLLDVNQQFPPFGAIPQSGNYFYIGSKEVFCKDWECVRMNLLWDRTRPEIESIYDNYDGNTNANGGAYIDLDNKVAIPNILQNSAWVMPNGGNMAGSLPLFSSSPSASDCHDCTDSNEQQAPCDPPEGSYQLVIKRGTSPENFILMPNDRECILSDYDRWDVLTSDAFLRLQIKNNTPSVTPTPPNNCNLFCHQEYSNLVLSAIDTNASPPTGLPLPPPYTPTLKEISIDYCALADNQSIELIHLHPFTNSYETQSTSSGSKPYLVPQFEAQGNLYIGLADLLPNNNLNLLFQMAASTADSFLPKAIVEWHYLTDMGWKQLLPDLGILSDGTNGLVQTGIVAMAIPSDIVVTGTNSTLLPPGLSWLRASVREGSQAVSETIAIHPHATLVTFEPTAESDLERLNTPLPHGSIAQAVQNIPGVQGFEQIYDGFGGRPEEKPDHFYLRVGEHLHHKGRAIDVFGYERLVLEFFPDIFKVKCIPHTLGRNVYNNDSTQGLLGFSNGDFEIAPGFVTLAVIPDLTAPKFQFADRLEPKVSAATLDQIKNFLRERISPFICLRILNPTYERVSVTTTVRFRAGKSIAFYLEQLENDIKEFLSPWAFGKQGEISFGGKLYQSMIINFIEQRDYVDYLQSFSMAKEGRPPSMVIEAESARSILVSANTHIVSALEDPCCEEAETTALPTDTACQIGFVNIGDGTEIEEDQNK